MSISQSAEEEFENEASLWSLSREFYEAAKTLEGNSPTQINYVTIKYYLLGHAAELALKSYLYKHGVAITELKKIGHNLKELSQKAEDKGFSQFQSIQELSPLYKAKELEYRQKKSVVYPSIESLYSDVRVLISRVFDHVSEF
ncbi:hypothetical protein [Vreelandella titanicae]|uniref:HEPN domain-containing protein n=1 Tax=Vreelandella titanicae TaxID=664683 RepID=A0A558JEN6_9GAMM|nr:hypothetical protein [Halomonas titanicae]TVU92088.1 hypothetical protein FQP89_02885 [Halomonas titanicae]